MVAGFDAQGTSVSRLLGHLGIELRVGWSEHRRQLGVWPTEHQVVPTPNTRNSPPHSSPVRRDESTMTWLLVALAMAGCAAAARPAAEPNTAAAGAPVDPASPLQSIPTLEGSVPWLDDSWTTRRIGIEADGEPPMEVALVADRPIISPVAEIEAYEDLADPMAAAPPAGHETRVVFLRPAPNGWTVVADWAHAAPYHSEGKVPVGVLRVVVQDLPETTRQLLFVDHAEWGEVDGLRNFLHETWVFARLESAPVKRLRMEWLEEARAEPGLHEARVEVFRARLEVDGALLHHRAELGVVERFAPGAPFVNAPSGRLNAFLMLPGL